MKSLWGELYKFTWIIWRITSLDCLGQSAPSLPSLPPQAILFCDQFCQILDLELIVGYHGDSIKQAQ